MNLGSNGKTAIICASSKGLGTAEEAADVIVFTASLRVRWINGRNIPVDGLELPWPPLDRQPF